jgi:hypothetical protein
LILAAPAPRRLRPLQSGRPPFGAEALAVGRDNYAAPYDAMALGLRMFAESNRRPVMISFESAADFRSVTTVDGAAEMASWLGPAFVLVATPVSYRRSVSGRAEIGVSGRLLGDPVAAVVSAAIIPATVQRLADRSRGTLVNLKDGEPTVLMEKMVSSLRTGYVLSYELPQDKGWHPVKVNVNRRGVSVAVRKGYSVD